MTTQRSVEQSKLVRLHCPLLAEGVEHIGHQQTRNRGTIGGSLCHLDPGAELPIIASVLDAEMTIASCANTRTIPFREFPVDYLTSVLNEDEIVTAITFPKTDPRTGYAFLEFNRRPADFAIVSVAAKIEFDEDRRIKTASILIGGISFAPVQLREAEEILLNLPPTPDLFVRASQAVKGIACDGDQLYPSAYRQELSGVLVARALVKASERAGMRIHA